MCGSSPLAEAVTRSTGTGWAFSGSAARSRAMRPFTASRSAGFVGPRFDPPLFAALYGVGDVAEGRDQKLRGSANVCPSSAEPTIRPSRSMRLPAACAGKTPCAEKWSP